MSELAVKLCLSWQKSLVCLIPHACIGHAYINVIIYLHCLYIILLVSDKVKLYYNNNSSLTGKSF